MVLSVFQSYKPYIPLKNITLGKWVVGTLKEQWL